MTATRVTAHLRLVSDNPWQELGRTRKAQTIAAQILEFAQTAPGPVTRDMVLRAIEPGTPFRRAVLKLCGFESASAETWQMVEGFVLLALGSGDAS